MISGRGASVTQGGAVSSWLSPLLRCSRTRWDLGVVRAEASIRRLMSSPYPELLIGPPTHPEPLRSSACIPVELRGFEKTLREIH